MHRKFLALSAGLLLLGACASEPEPTAIGADGGTGGYAGSQPTGLGPGAGGRDISSTALGAPRPGSQEELAATIGDRLFFEYDRYDLTPEARRQVEAWADWLRRYPAVAVVIEGHADERGTREYNLALGERRATTVRDYLIAQGISPNRLRTISYGKERPAVVGSTEASWAQNRRAVLTVQ